MGLLQQMGKGQGYLKGGFLGFPKSGKTYTAALLAVATARLKGMKGPVAMFDTEGGSEYIAPLVEKLTGQRMVGVKSRAFDQLCQVAKECREAGVSVLLVDSVTHVWRELCDSYLARTNEFRARKGWEARKKLEFQDWGVLKGEWARWTDLYLNLPLDIIICGRAGFEYDMQANDETGKKELVKTGVKMKTESEFGFEPSLLVEMEREQVPTKDGGFQIRRSATVLGDRFGMIDGQSAVFPSIDGKVTDKAEKELAAVMAFFRAHLDKLNPAAHTPIDTTSRSAAGVESDEDGWALEKKRRAIYCEEIQAELLLRYPSQGADDKAAKAKLIKAVFDTGSWTAVESMSADVLKDGLQLIRVVLKHDPKLDRIAEITPVNRRPEKPTETAADTGITAEDVDAALGTKPAP